MASICSKCHKGFNECQCDTFHPNITALEIYKPEAELLYRYFLRVGYISYTDYPEVHLFINRLREFLES